MFEKNLVDFKVSPTSPWTPWPYLPPVKGTLEILRREGMRAFSRAMKYHAQAVRKGLTGPAPSAYCLFYGEAIWGFRFKKTNECWNLEKGFVPCQS